MVFKQGEKVKVECDHCKRTAEYPEKGWQVEVVYTEGKTYTYNCICPECKKKGHKI